VEDQATLYSNGVLAAGIVGLILAGIWVAFLLSHGREHLDPGTVAIECVLIVFGALAILWAVRREPDIALPSIAALLLVEIGLILLIFTVDYYDVGTKHNFSQPLTHLDAVYFPLGTVSTAGTGNGVATSERARALQSVQMGIDLLVFVVVLTALLTRYVGSGRSTNGEVAPPTQEDAPKADDAR
jgi:hypothetical protein